MPTVVRKTVARVPYRVAGDERLGGVSYYSSAFVTCRLGTMPFRASTTRATEDLVAEFLGPEFDHEYGLAGGTLRIGTFYVQQEEGGPRFPQTVGVWSDGEVALCAQTNAHGADWVRDFFAEVRPARQNQSAVLLNAGAQFDSAGTRLLLTLDGIGLMEIEVLGGRRPQGPGRTVRTGEMYRTETPNGPGVYLATQRLGAHFHLLEVSPDEVADFVANLTAFDQAA